MAKILLDNAGKVSGYVHTIIDPTVALPPHAGEFDFDADTNPILVAALNNEPRRVTVVNGAVLLDGNPLTVNAERPEVTLRRNVLGLKAKVEAGAALTAPEMQLALRFLLKNVIGTLAPLSTPGAPPVQTPAAPAAPPKGKKGKKVPPHRR